jgi:hypothetical protein
MVSEMRHSLGFAVLLTATILLAACSSPAVSGGGETSESAPASTPAAEQTEAAQVESLPFNASGLLAGPAQPNFPAGEPDEVSVVQVGPLSTETGTLVFAFRNNTSEGISHVDWTGTARSDGSIVATGSSQGTVPAQVQPGEVGLAYIFFDNAGSIPDGSEYEFSVSTSAVDTSSYNTAPLKVTEANLIGESIVGAATNATGAETVGPYAVGIYCFEGDNLLSQSISFAEQMDEVPDGGSVTFSANLFGDACPAFAVGVSGYFS